jgi:hypothetical protein
MQVLTIEQIDEVSGGLPSPGIVAAAAVTGAVGGALAGARTGNPYAVLGGLVFGAAVGAAAALIGGTLHDYVLKNATK